MINVPTDLLRTFVTIVELGGFTRAGDALGRSQPAISLQIKRLEELLQVQLLQRDARELALTSEGETVALYARQILFLNDELFFRLGSQEIAGTIRIGIPNDFAVSFLPEILGSFNAAHLNVTLEVICDISANLLDRLSPDDLSIVIAMGEDAGGPVVKSWAERLAWVADPSKPSYEQSPLPLVAYPEGCVYRRRMTQTLNRAGIPWRIAYTSPSLSGIRAAVSAGLGLTVLSEKTIPSGLQPLPREANFPGLADVAVGLYYDRASLNDAALRLINHIIASMDRAHGMHRSATHRPPALMALAESPGAA